MAEIILGRVLGQQGVKGDNGSTPYVGANGNWWIENSDTGVPANQAVSVQEKVKINGVSTNVNFIRNEVVQDLYVSLGKNISMTKGTPKYFSEIYTDKNYFSIKQDFIVTENGVSENILLSIRSDETLYAVYVGIYNGKLRFGVNLSGTLTWTDVITLNINTRCSYELLHINDKVIIRVNGVQKEMIFYKPHTKFKIRSGTYYVMDSGAAQSWSGTIYNFELDTSPHNFSVLNNTPSISSLETTDSSSVKTSFLISSDTDHVADRTGRVQEEINRVFYKQNCKEFTSNGENIIVNNGLEGYVLQGKLEGQTIKNYCPKLSQNFSGEASRIRSINVKNLDATKTYTFFMNVYESFGSSILFSQAKDINNSDIFNKISINVNGNKIYKQVFTGVSSIVQVYFNQGVLNESVWFKTDGYMILEGNWTNKDISYIPFGLSSTQATIYNNGLKYSFYKDATDKASGTVITFGGVGIVGDTLEIKEDGSGVYTKNFIFKKALSTDAWVQSSVNTDDIYFGVYNLNLKEPAYLNTSLYMSNRLQNIEHTNWTSGTKKEFFTVYDASINIKLLKSILQTPDIEGFKKWLDANEFIFCYRLATPVVTTIPKEIMPTILTQATNKFTFGDAVKPSSVEITVPVDKVTDLETRLSQVEKVITSVSNLSLLGNYAEDEYNNSINQL